MRSIRSPSNYVGSNHIGQSDLSLILWPSTIAANLHLAFQTCRQLQWPDNEGIPLLNCLGYEYAYIPRATLPSLMIKRLHSASNDDPWSCSFISRGLLKWPIGCYKLFSNQPRAVPKDANLTGTRATYTAFNRSNITMKVAWQQLLLWPRISV